MLTAQLCNYLSRAGQLSLAGEGDANALLEVVITEYEKTPWASSERDTGISQSFRLKMTVSCTLKNRATNEVYFKDRLITKYITAYAASGQAESEYQNMPQLTREIAKDAANEVTAIW